MMADSTSLYACAKTYPQLPTKYQSVGVLHQLPFTLCGSAPGQNLFGDNVLIYLSNEFLGKVPKSNHTSARTRTNPGKTKL